MLTLRRWLPLACALATGCSSTKHGARVDAPVLPDGASDAAASSGNGATAWTRDWTAHPAVFEQTGASRLWGVSDVHGDPDRLVALLAGGGVAGGTRAAPTWLAGTDTLIVTGDNIDKGALSIEVLDYWMKLIPLAEAAGGRVVVLAGNHEIEFLADPNNSKAAPLDSEIARLSPSETPQLFADPDTDVHGRFLHERPIAAVVDGWFFSHAGDSGGSSAAAIAAQYTSLVDQGNWSDPFFLGSNSIIEAKSWWPSSGTASFLDGYLAALPAKHIVFGHSPPSFHSPPTGNIEMHFAGRLTLIDVGMSSAVNYSTGKLLRVDAPGTASERAGMVDPSGHVTALDLTAN